MASDRILSVPLFFSLAVGNWFSLSGSTVTVGQRTRSGKCVSDNVSVSGMVPSSKAFAYVASTSVPENPSGEFIKVI